MPKISKVVKLDEVIASLTWLAARRQKTTFCWQTAIIVTAVLEATSIVEAISVADCQVQQQKAGLKRAVSCCSK
jgi:hypothetical protein